jgi:hypothetical protein
MQRFEVLGDHPATATTGTSGRVARKDVAAAALKLSEAGYVGIIVIDHDTGEERDIEEFLRRFEVRGEHRATDTTGTSGRVARKDVAAAALQLFKAGHGEIVVIDHVTGEEYNVEDFLCPGESLY